MQHKTDWKNGDIVDAVAVNRIETNAKELEIGKVDKEDGKQLSSNDYTDSEKEKLAAIEEGATNYQHPSSHPSSMITYIDNKGIGGTDLQTVVDLVVDKTEDLSSALSGFVGKTTTFNSDGSITETESNGDVKVTSFLSNGDIQEQLTKADGSITTKTTHFNADGSITEVVS